MALNEQQIQKLIEIGNLWVSSDGSKQRVYFNDLTERMQLGFNLKIDYYNTGNVCAAKLNGEKISNAAAKRYLQSVPNKFWYDYADGRFHWQGGDRETGLTISKTIKNEIGI